jgi:hypothetical protein
VKKIILFIFILGIGLGAYAQDSASKKTVVKSNSKTEKRQRRDAIIKQEEEEGILAYRKQSGFGLQVRTNGYGLFYELGRRRSPRFTNTYSLELTEIKNNKEEKVGGQENFFGNPFIYGKINNFYQAKLGFGQQYIMGQKGNKNGIAVIAIAQAGLSLGLLKPYYINADNGTGTKKTVKYNSPDSVLFLSTNGNSSSAGFTKGFNEMKIQPGAYIKAALRFDFGRYNESMQALEIGMSLEAYAQKIPILVYNDPKQLFFQGHVAFVFGRRK